MLRDAVKEIALNEIDGMSSEDARYWMENDAICGAGSVGALIYYADTEPFAKEYHDEIVELMNEFGIEGAKDLNYMAWFGFEATLPELIEEIISDVEDIEADAE